MSEEVFKISIPSDNDGFITFQCPFCRDRFKLTVTDFEREDIIEIFCPYCGLRHENSNFLTDEVIEQANIIAENYAKSIINKWTKDLERSFRNNKHIKFKANKPLKMDAEKILFEKEELETYNLKCCQVTVKTRPIHQVIGVYCPCCGVR
ncbi:MAG: TFIIB-type zinc ribbon-containing protein [Cyanobacteria bacterium P01_A01_bin.68]